ncbi:MAG: flagellar biosynthetic protein FliO [Planctomycetaceae bacterium]|nr:flagellar biosynthetic protein FliO [Planctomycetaceae bacterium]
MKLATTATVGSNDRAPTSRARERTPDVNRWVAMLDAELRAEDTPSADAQTAVEVTFEFGRSTLDPAATPLGAGDSLRLDQLADEPLDVLVAGRPVARGELVTVEGQLGVRIVELLMLVVAWFAIGLPTIMADERPVSILFDDNPPELLETPLGTARINRSEPAWSNDVRSSTARRVDGTISHESTSAPLTPRSAKPNNGDAAPNRPGWSATVLPLLFVVGLIVVGARWLKSRSPETARGLPSEVFEILGRKAVDTRTSVVLARSGTRVLLLSLSPHGLQTLAEITDPVEVDCLAGLCHATHREQSLVETFRSLLHKPVDPKSNLRQPSTATSLEERLAARQMIGAYPSVSPEVRP